MKEKDTDKKKKKPVEKQAENNQEHKETAYIPEPQEEEDEMPEFRRFLGCGG